MIYFFWFQTNIAMKNIAEKIKIQITPLFS